MRTGQEGTTSQRAEPEDVGVPSGYAVSMTALADPDVASGECSRSSRNRSPLSGDVFSAEVVTSRLRAAP